MKIAKFENSTGLWAKSIQLWPLNLIWSYHMLLPNCTRSILNYFKNTKIKSSLQRLLKVDFSDHHIWLLGRTLTKFNQLKRNKRFDNFIKLVWVQQSLFHIAAWSHPVHEAWRSHDSLYRGQIQKLLQCCLEPYQQIPLVITIQKESIVWPIYDEPFRSYWRKGQRSKFWLHMGQTGKSNPILLAMVSKCSSSKYN